MAAELGVLVVVAFLETGIGLKVLVSPAGQTSVRMIRLVIHAT